jgi:LysR family transcriptional activator of nhaA
MSLRFSYRHLYYFWVVAKEGGIAKGAARLEMAVQTVSSQVRELERALGATLLKPAGRTVELTEAGKAALRQAERIFELGEELPSIVRVEHAATVRLKVGVANGLPKLIVHRLMQPVLKEPNLRLLCHEASMDDLLADLALHRLDIVIADAAPAPNPNIRLYTHALGSSPLAWYAPPRWESEARRGLPQSLARVPVLLPTPHGALRARLDRWFELHSVTPRVAGEFEDSALLKAFAAGGMGIFAAADAMRQELKAQYGVRRIAPCEGVEEHFFAIGTDKRIQHPLVGRLVAQRL